MTFHARRHCRIAHAADDARYRARLNGGVCVAEPRAAAMDDLRASGGSAIRRRAQLRLWKSSAHADGAPSVEKEHRRAALLVVVPPHRAGDDGAL